MGRKEGPPEPTVSFTPEASEETVLAAWTPMASSCAYCLTLGVYAAECRGIHYGTHSPIGMQNGVLGPEGGLEPDPASWHLN